MVGTPARITRNSRSIPSSGKNFTLYIRNGKPTRVFIPALKLYGLRRTSANDRVIVPEVCIDLLALPYREKPRKNSLYRGALIIFI